MGGGPCMVMCSVMTVVMVVTVTPAGAAWAFGVIVTSTIIVSVVTGSTRVIVLVTSSTIVVIKTV